MYSPIYPNIQAIAISGVNKGFLSDHDQVFINYLKNILTAIWHNPEFRMQIIPEWNKIGIRTVHDLLTSNRSIMTQSEFETYYKLKTNFLVYGRVKNKIKEFLSDKEMPMYEELNPQNSMINMIISLDRKGVSNINKTIRGRSMDILHNICQKWDSKASIILFDDVYLRYILFRTLHYRFFTNDMLKKFTSKTDICDFSKEESDSNFHILIDRKIIQSLWWEVNDWIFDLGEDDHILSDDSWARPE